MVKQDLGTITILIGDRQADAIKVQEILTKFGHLVIARTGVNIEPKCLEHCTGLVAVFVKGDLKKMNQLTAELDNLATIQAKLVVVSK